MFDKFKKYLASPFQNAAHINRGVMRDYLRPLKGKFLELGPGNTPLLKNLNHVKAKNKYVIEFKEVSSYCHKLGYTCLDQDMGKEKWNLKDNSIDVVVGSQCLEHIPDTDHVISEAHRVLKPGGLLLLTVPNQAALAYILMMLFTINPPMNMVSDKYYGLGNVLSTRRWEKSAEYETKGHGHLRLFATRAMNDLLRIYGFKVISNHGGTWGIPFAGKFLAKIFPYYGLFTIVLAKKVTVKQWKI
jgi:SAM-dependent methyltransferase